MDTSVPSPGCSCAWTDVPCTAEPGEDGLCDHCRKYHRPYDPDCGDGTTPLEHVVISKMLDDKGELRIAHDATDGLNTWEAIGMVTACGDKAGSSTTSPTRTATRHETLTRHPTRA